MSSCLPYKLLYSVGLDCCKRCSKQIQAGKVQIAILMQSDEEDCQYPEWFHQKCFFKTRLPSTEAVFDGFAKLRYSDQTVIRKQLGLISESNAASEKAKLPDYGIDYARVTRDSCFDCKKKIRKSEMRIMKVASDANQNGPCDGVATWYHIECFARSRQELGFLESGQMLPGFRRLKEEDQELVKQIIPLIKRETQKSTEPIESDIELAALEKQIEEQNKKYYEVFDQLAEHISHEIRIKILDANCQYLPTDEIESLHHLTDVICFGALAYCKKCESGHMLFTNWCYECVNTTPWAKCDYKTQTPERIAVQIRSNKYPFLSTLLRPKEAPTANRALHRFRLIDDNGNDLVYVPYKHPPLFNMEFVVIGKLHKSKEEITKMIEKMGGKVIERVNSRLAAVISNEAEVQRMGPQMKEAKKLKIQVVSLNFLTEMQSDPLLYVISESLCTWGGDPFARVDQIDVKSRRETAFYTKSLPEKITHKLNGIVVDPECGLDENSHVYTEDLNGKLVHYSVALGLVDIENNRNSYHRMQLLKSNELELFWVFESGGRISTVIGSKRLHTFGKLEAARKKFHDIYEEKTGNEFGARKFVKRANKFYHLDINSETLVKVPNNVVETKLNKSIYELMQMLFDLKKMEGMMISCDLDLKQMPLGKISRKQMEEAMKILQTISKLIGKVGSQGKLVEASNRFYTMIPHSFGVKRPTAIDSIDVVNAKCEMLESLMNMELIYGYLDGESGEKNNPLDACYPKLKADIMPLDRYSSEYAQLCDVVRLTHGPTHRHYTLEVLEIFKVVRDGEADRFQAFENLQNHQLLWHGSRLMNFVSILSNGLKIAPPEAPVSGYMFGKGIYFADIVSKSANYCYCDSHNNTGLMMLCEVALGNSELLVAAQHVTHIPNDTNQSIKGCGVYYPANVISFDGVGFAYSNIQVERRFRTCLQYNEYIVYDPSQVKIKYLFKMKFNFNRSVP